MAQPTAHQPLRRCRVCRRQAPKADLLRWVMKNGQLTPDEQQIQPGRGLYTCSDACRERLPKIKGLNR